MSCSRCKGRAALWLNFPATQPAAQAGAETEAEPAHDRSSNWKVRASRRVQLFRGLNCAALMALMAAAEDPDR